MPLRAKSLYLSLSCPTQACANSKGAGRATQAAWFSARLPRRSPVPSQDASSKDETESSKKEPGAMSRRLSEMQDASIEEGGRGAKKSIEEAGFDDELKQKLLDRIAGATFKSDNAQALSEANMPSSAGKGTRDTAAAPVWTGTESIHDVSLRMLDDSHKRLRSPFKIPSPRGPPVKVDTGRSKTKPSSGVRLANARDRSSIYASLQDGSMSEKEREKYRQELKERFAPAARPIPATLQGLASLANERIEDAIARGQFKNLPRGKPLERDYNMSSPFLDTTEYFMNKIIQKQDIVPPWIEKQQELVSASTKFRSRLRVEWRRHAARMISSGGGSVESQIRRAEEYAAAEAIVNPRKRKEETINTVDKEGHMSQITLTGKLTTPTGADASRTTTEIKVVSVPTPELETTTTHASPAPHPEAVTITSTTPTPAPIQHHTSTPLIVFRDPAWEKTELAYHELAIANLNSLARSYNLMAPNLAKKPYFSLARELRSCYADVAPQLAGEIAERARAPTLKFDVVAHKPGGVMERFSAETPARVWDERKPQYGFKEFWRDLFPASKT